MFGPPDQRLNRSSAPIATSKIWTTTDQMRIPATTAPSLASNHSSIASHDPNRLIWFHPPSEQIRPVQQIANHGNPGKLRSPQIQANSGAPLATRLIRATYPGPAPQAQIRCLLSMASTSRTQPQQWAIPDPDREHRDPTRRLLPLWPASSLNHFPNFSSTYDIRSRIPSDQQHVFKWCTANRIQK
ncbi:hypothetical protein ACLOJK_028557 [Asimina triloba]